MTIENNRPQRTSSIVGIAIAVVVIATIIGIWFVKTNNNTTGVIRQVTYQVDASGGYAQIIFTSSVGVNTEAEILTTPFFKTVNLPVGAQVYLTASNPSQTGDIICKIKINGRDWKESRGTHPIDSVACGGIVR